MQKIGLSNFIKIIVLFVTSRLAMLAVFVFATSYFSSIPPEWNYSSNPLLNFLGRWDTGWYLRIADWGYVNTPLTEGQSSYGFFPLYPMAMKLFGLLTGDNFTGGIIASNLFLIITALFLYLLTLKIYNNRATALMAAALLFFFPGSYLFSGVFSEASFICFSIMCVYFFETENYFLSGVSGFLLALTRPFGVLLLLPLFIRYMQKSTWKINPSALYLLLIPTGVFTFFTYCYFTTGDFLIYVHAKQIGWSTESSNPCTILFLGLTHATDSYTFFNACYTAVVLFLLLLLYRYVPFYLLLWVLLLIAAPLANGSVNLICMPRYIVVCFPVMMAIARFSQNFKLGKTLIFLLTVINLILAALYSLGYQFTA